MKSIGVIVDHHPETAIVYRSEFIEQMAQRFPNDDPPPTIIHELHGRAIDYALRRKDQKAAERLIVRAALECKAAGAQGILLASSVFHFASRAVEKATGLPLLHLAVAALNAVRAHQLNHAALLGTQLAAELQCWQRCAAQRRVRLTLPSAPIAQRVAAILHAACRERAMPERPHKELTQICKDFERSGAEVIILAPPQLQLFLHEKHTDLPQIRAMEIQVANAITWSTGMTQSGFPPAAGCVMFP